MFYRKIIKNFLKNSKLFKELNNGTEILVGQAVFTLWIKTVKILFGSITQEPLGLPNFDAIFSSWDNLLYDAYVIFQKDVDDFEIAHKTC